MGGCGKFGIGSCASASGPGSASGIGAGMGAGATTWRLPLDGGLAAALAGGAAGWLGTNHPGLLWACELSIGASQASAAPRAQVPKSLPLREKHVITGTSYQSQTG
jgi:hypothetical protein